MPGSQPLLQEAVTRKARSHAKVLALSFMLASVGCALVFWGELDSKELRPTFSELIARMASANIQSRSWKPARSWQQASNAGRSSPIAGSSSLEAREWINNWKQTQAEEKATPIEIRKPIKIGPTWIGYGGVTAAGSWDQESLKKALNERSRVKGQGYTFSTYTVKALKPITCNGANVPVGTLGTLESSVVAWDNGEYTTDAKRSVDYQIVKNLPGSQLAYEDARFGLEVTAEDLQNAFSDLSGMFTGDCVAAMRSDGKWQYGYAAGKSGFSRTGDGQGLSLTIRFADGGRKVYDANDWDKLKQLKEPKANRGWGKLTSQATNPLMLKVGETVPTEDLEKASTDLSKVGPGDVVAALRSDGSWTYAFVENLIGSTRKGAAGTGILLKIDDLGREKKVLKSELAKNVKALATK